MSICRKLAQMLSKVSRTIFLSVVIQIRTVSETSNYFLKFNAPNSNFVEDMIFNQWDLSSIQIIEKYMKHLKLTSFNTIDFYHDLNKFF